MSKFFVKVRFWKKVISGLMAFIFAVGSVSTSYAQNSMTMPTSGSMVSLSIAFMPPLLKGVKVYSDNPFRLDFILDQGNSSDPADQLKAESTRLIKYFLASITVPEKDLWVNLSPYEKDRIVPDAFGVTEMGRDLLVQDYMLKQITASVIYPEGEIGKAFWAKVYAEAQKQYGTTDVPVDTFNKVWIVPEKAVVYESKDSAYVVESKLKVMLEEDYLALEMNTLTRDQKAPTMHKLGSDIVREVVIPILEKEVNEGKNFAQLRQVYYSLILAVWYKDKVKESIFGKVYVDQKKTDGVDIEDKAEKEKIWAQYVEAFRKGAYNYIKEDIDPATQESVARRYFSGGVVLGNTLRDVVEWRPADQYSFFDSAESKSVIVQTDLVVPGLSVPPAPRGWITTDNGILVPAKFGLQSAGAVSAKSKEEIKAQQDLDESIRLLNSFRRVDDVRAIGREACLKHLKRMLDLRLLQEKPALLDAVSAETLMNVAVDQGWKDVVSQTARAVLAYDQKGLTQDQRAAWMRSFRSSSLAELKEDPVFGWITDHLWTLTPEEFLDYARIVNRMDASFWAGTGLPETMTFGIELEMNVVKSDGSDNRTRMLSDLLQESLPVIWGSDRWDLGTDGDNIEIRTIGGMPNTQEGWSIFLGEWTAIIKQVNEIVSQWNKQDAQRSGSFKIKQGLHIHVGNGKEADLARVVPQAGVIFTALEKLMSGLAGGRPVLTFGPFELGGNLGGTKNETPLYFDDDTGTIAINTLEPPRISDVLNADDYARQMQAAIILAMSIVHSADSQDWNMLRTGMPVRYGDIFTHERFSAQTRNLVRLFDGNRIDLWRTIWLMQKKQALGVVVPDGFGGDIKGDLFIQSVEMFLKSGSGLAQWLRDSRVKKDDIARVSVAVLMWGNEQEKGIILSLLRSKEIDVENIRKVAKGVYLRTAWDFPGIGEIRVMLWAPQNDMIFVRGSAGSVLVNKDGHMVGEPVTDIEEIGGAAWSPQGDMVFVRGNSEGVLMNRKGNIVGDRVIGIGELWEAKWSAQGDTVFVIGSAGVVVMDKEGHMAGGRIRGMRDLVNATLSPQGDMIFVIGNSGSVLMTKEGDLVGHRVSGIGELWDATWSTQGDTVFVRGSAGGVLMNKKGDMVGKRIIGIGEILDVTWSAQGDMVFVKGSFGSMFLRQDGQVVKPLDGMGDILDASWSLQGDMVFVMGSTGGVLMNKEGDFVGDIVSEIGIISSARWSLQGDMIFLVGNLGSVLMNKKGHILDRRITGIGTLWDVTWSAQGDMFFVTGDLGGLLMNKGGDRVGRPITGIGTPWDATWSAQGDRVFVTGSLEGVLLNKEGDTVGDHVTGIGQIRDAMWSSQGDKLLVIGSFGSVLMDQDGGKSLSMGGSLIGAKFVDGGIVSWGPGGIVRFYPFDPKTVEDQAQSRVVALSEPFITPGGIDLTRERMDVQTTRFGNGIEFHFDQAQMEQMKNAPGLAPVIINIQPMTTTVSMFLGINKYETMSRIGS